MCEFFGMNGLENIRPDTDKAQNLNIQKTYIFDPL